MEDNMVMCELCGKNPVCDSTLRGEEYAEFMYCIDCYYMSIALDNGTYYL